MYGYGAPQGQGQGQPMYAPMTTGSPVPNIRHAPQAVSFMSPPGGGLAMQMQQMQVGGGAYYQQPHQGYFSPAGPQCNAPQLVGDCFGNLWAMGAPMFSSATAVAAKPKAVVAYEALMTKELAAFKTECGAYGPPLLDWAAKVGAMFEGQKAMIKEAASRPRPDAEGLQRITQGLGAALGAFDELKDATLSEFPAFKPHLFMIAGALSCMGWVTSSTPAGLVSDSLNAIPTYGRAVAAEGELGSALVEKLKELLKALRDYCQAHHPDGLAWQDS
eukprot:CAMPEP_0180290042 /NCGR_PEP_ID=MMETSP0988-20121125/15149_1 /TAXON_ID=697907 /ORGANISM="non described non described, Strain CCMP2293" /LENGTH=273 /DNA_ID=CAMNT_0022265317 /DNA_START=71 /DNA_END=889 /DNA_ORIENTATION=+